VLGGPSDWVAGFVGKFKILYVRQNPNCRLE
jgi:hypothetical protein